MVATAISKKRKVRRTRADLSSRPSARRDSRRASRGAATRDAAPASRLGSPSRSIDRESTRARADAVDRERGRTRTKTNITSFVDIDSQFVADGVFFAELNEMLVRELAEDGYSGVEVRQTPMRTEIIIRATRTANVLGEKGRRIRELTTLVQRRFQMAEGSVELYAERVNNRGLCAIAQCESLRYKLLGGLAVRRCVCSSIDRKEWSRVNFSRPRRRATRTQKRRTRRPSACDGRRAVARVRALRGFQTRRRGKTRGLWRARREREMMWST